MLTIEDRKVSVPEGKIGSAEIKKFSISELEAQLSCFTHGTRSVRAGDYTKLLINDSLWMSDTRAEVYDHYPAIHAMSENDRVLIHGLGIGVVVQAAIVKGTSHVDVVEINPDVVALVGPHYMAMAQEAGVSLHIHTDDCFKKKWPPNTHWNTVWHDIWRDLCTDNINQMSKLHRMFGRRCDWQGSWAHDLLLDTRRRNKARYF